MLHRWHRVSAQSLHSAARWLPAGSSKIACPACSASSWPARAASVECGWLGALALAGARLQKRYRRAKGMCAEREREREAKRMRQSVDM